MKLSCLRTKHSVWLASGCSSHVQDGQQAEAGDIRNVQAKAELIRSKVEFQGTVHWREKQRLLTGLKNKRLSDASLFIDSTNNVTPECFRINKCRGANLSGVDHVLQGPAARGPVRRYLEQHNMP